MKLFALFCFLIPTIYLFSAEKVNGESNIKWAIEQLKTLSPEEYQVLNCYDQLPDKFSVNTGYGTMSSQKMGSTYEFMHEGDKFSCLMDIETNVHEVNHMITHCYPYEYCRINNRVVSEKNMYYFYLGKENEMVLFSDIDFFPSRDIAAEIPKSNRTFRYSEYIEGNTSTQDNGLLGLLDEYNSYHHSLTTAWKLKEAYLSATSDKVKGYISWMSSLNSVAQAYYEFRYYILEYLRYAKMKDPDIYDQIKEETDLITIFNRITESYRIILTKYNDEMTDGCKNYWQPLGYDAYPGDDGKFFYIGKNGAATGFLVQMEDRDKLLPLLQSNRYDEVIKKLNILP